MNKIKRPIEAIADDLKLALTREASNIIAIGDLLLEARETVDHGDWRKWLAANFGSSSRTADNYMNAANFAAKCATVAHLKLSPTALYLLGDKMDVDDPLFTPEAIDAILKAAKTEWITDKRAYAIAQALKASPTEIEEDEEQSLTDQEINDILDGPPPVVPPEPTVSNVDLPPFDSAVATLARLQTKLLSSFFGTAHTPDQIENVIAFLLAVSDSITKQRAA